MINKVSDLACYDRNMTVGEIIDQFKKERPYVCPKCNGSGKILHEPEENFEMGGWHDNATYSQCDICDGHGRTKKKFVPVYKLVDYKECDIPNETNED